MTTIWILGIFLEKSQIQNVIHAQSIRETELCQSMGELTPLLEMLMRRNRAGLCFKTIRND